MASSKHIFSLMCLTGALKYFTAKTKKEYVSE